jgi:hypothetical protein
MTRQRISAGVDSPASRVSGNAQVVLLLRKCGESAINSFDLPCKWPSNAYAQGVLVAFIPKNG